MSEQQKLRTGRPLAIVALSALLQLVASQDARADGNSISDIRSTEEGSTTTVRIAGSSTPTFTVYKLENPDRVVVDVAKASLNGSLTKEDDKASWSFNTWSVGQVSASEMQKTRGNLVRVVVALSRPSRYQVKASGNDVLVKVTATTAPPAKVDAGDGGRAELAAARKQAADEIERARAEAARIRESAERDASTAKKKIAEAESLMTQAMSDKRAADSARKSAAAELNLAKERANAAQAAEQKATEHRRQADQAARDAEAARTLAEQADRDHDAGAKTLRARAEAAAREAEARLRKAESAAATAEARRKEAEAATAAAEQRRMKAATAMASAVEQQKQAESRRDQAMQERKLAEESRQKAEQASRVAKERASALQQAAAEEEKRLASARQVRAREENSAELARRARAELDAKNQSAATAEKQIASARLEMQQAQQRLREQEARAREAEERAQKAAGDSKLSAERRDQIQKEASELAALRDATRRELAEQKQMLVRLSSSAEKLVKEQRVALSELEVLRRQATEAQALRAREEASLQAIRDQRSRAQSDFDRANAEKDKAQLELARVQQLRDQAEAMREKARKEALLAQSEAQAIRHEAEANRKASQEAMARARAHEQSAEKELAVALAARESARKNSASTASAIAAAEKREQAARAELARAQSARENAEAAQREGQKVLASAEKREREADSKMARAAAEQAQPTERRVAKSVEPATRVREVDVVQKPDASRVVIALSAPGTPKVIKNRGKEAILEIPSASIAESLERTLDTSAQAGAIRAVSSYRDPKRADYVRVVVELNEPAEGVLKKVGNTFYWDFPAKPVAAPTTVASAPAPQPKGKVPVRAKDYPTQAVASYGAAAAPITQKTVAQVSNRRQRTYRGKKIDIDTRNAEFHALMRLIAEEAGVNIVVPDAIKANVTIRLRRVPWDQALDVILASKGLGYKLEGPGLYRIATRKELDQELEDKINRAKVRAESEPVRPVVFNLNYVDAQKVKTQLAPLVSARGQVEVDARTNAVIINDVEANRARMIDLLTRLDTQTPQIQIEARIVEARTTFVREFGIQWGGNMSASAAGGNATGLVFPSSIGLAGAADDGQTPTAGIAATPSDFAVNLPAAIGTGSGGGIGLSLGSVGGNFGLNLRLSALEDNGSVRIISSPKITTSNNIQASIKSGVSIPISVVSANGAQTTFVPADLELKVKPTVSLRDCAVSMEVDVKKNEADFANTGSRGDPSIITKEAKTTILVEDGQTSVIGGIYTRNNSESFSKVPVLGDIPVFGWLFKSMRETDSRSEVLVFLTPKITNREALPCQ